MCSSDLERTLQDAVARYPVADSALLEYAAVAERQNHVEAARRALISYSALVSGGSDFPARAARIAALSLRVDDAPTAVTWLQRAADATPNDVGALASLADAQLRAGDRVAAAATIALGLEKDPTNVVLQALEKRR